MKKSEEKPIPWAVTDPKPPEVHSGQKNRDRR